MFDLYKDIIIDHGNNPRNKYIMKNYTHNYKAYNYLCGDSFIIYLNVCNNIIDDISFDGSGCVISVASASLMTIALKGNSLCFALKVFDYFKGIVVKGYNVDKKFERLNILVNVRNSPSRIKCVTLIWNAFYNAVNFDVKK